MTERGLSGKNTDILNELKFTSVIQEIYTKTDLVILLKDKVFKLKFNIKTWLKIFKNRYRDTQVHIDETNEQRMQRLTSDRNQHMFTRSIESDALQRK